MSSAPETAIPNHVREQFAPYLEDTNRYIPPCLRARYVGLRAMAADIDRIRDRLDRIRAGVAAIRVEAPRPAALPADKNAGAS